MESETLRKSQITHKLHLSDLPRSNTALLTICGGGFGDRGAALTNLSCLFESVTHLEHAPVVMVAAHDLDADGQPAARESAGNGHGRIPHRRDVISGLHPGDVTFHFHTGNFGGVMEVHVKRQKDRKSTRLNSSHVQ